MDTDSTTKESTLINMANLLAFQPYTSCYTAQSIRMKLRLNEKATRNLLNHELLILGKCFL